MRTSKYSMKEHEVGSSSTLPSVMCEDLSIPSSSNDKEGKETSLQRRKVKQALATFRDLSDKFYSEYISLRLGPVQAKAAKPKSLAEAVRIMKERYQWENTKPQVGHVPGVEVGDRFDYWGELLVIGLHHQYRSGIDFMDKGQTSVATSVVVTNRKDNVMRPTAGQLVYLGHGGNPSVRTNNLPSDQKLEGGNLALKNSMDARSPVRVILRVSEKIDGIHKCSKSAWKESYVYDGLYSVDEMAKEKGKHGTLEFRFTMNKIQDQPPCSSSTPRRSVVTKGRFDSLALQRKRRIEGHKALQGEVVRINDISEGKEKHPIRVMALRNCVELPPAFDYHVSMIYPEKFNQSTLRGCDCVDCKTCPCIVKNGGIMPYDSNKRLVSVSTMESSLIYECGPSCKCSLSCINRVSQCGIQFQLEIFQKFNGWGVRTRSYIRSGSFVCEIIGEARSRPHVDVVDDYIFNIGSGKGYYIDARRYGNIGRFINHSCSPNLCVKDVMYDHTDKSLPHKMLFAVNDIPSGKELSYDYNLLKGEYLESNR